MMGEWWWALHLQQLNEMETYELNLQVSFYDNTHKN